VTVEVSDRAPENTVTVITFTASTPPAGAESVSELVVVVEGRVRPHVSERVGATCAHAHEYDSPAAVPVLSGTSAS
jgi:hypothetical protein